MNTPPAAIRAWAQRLLAVEAAEQPTSTQDLDVVVRVSEKLRISLTRIVGADGFTALLRRAVALARADIPALQTVTVTGDGRLEGLERFVSEGADGVQAAIAITSHLLGLLFTFIGEPLALRLMHDAWPDASGPLTKESEDFK